MSDKKIERPYELILSIGADTVEGIANQLHNIATDMFMAVDGAKEKGVPPYQDRHTSVSGGPSSNHVLELRRTATADHDAYFKELDEYLEKIRNEQPGGQM